MKNNRYKFLIPFILILFVVFLTELFSAGVSSTKHNLSVSGPGSVKSTSETQVCIFCHTPHHASKEPLWNKPTSTATYNLYTSPTKNAIMAQPNGSSVYCMSCHDGTIALGTVNSPTIPINFGGVTTLVGKGNLGTDLRNDHPFSFDYNTDLVTADGQLLSPTALGNGLSLEAGKVQCETCHDPHTNKTTSFLKVTTENSALCVSCHNKTGWLNSTHATSTKTWNGSGVNPWPHSPATYTTVQSNGCESCHNPHNSDHPINLMNYKVDNDNCMSCHNGNGSGKNLQTEFSKTYKHDVANTSYNSIHNPVENNLVENKHVACVDCHNPHQSNASTASAPNVNGFTTGVKGVDATGNPVNPAVYEYQICFKCHSSNTWKPSARTPRVVNNNNVMDDFNVNNISYHPIVNNKASTTDNPSLIPPWTSSSIMKCTDCHASDGINAPKGPHGSNFVPILKKQYITTDYTTESEANYALCYDCHNRNSIMGDEGFKYHNKHLTEYKTPCNVCHDAHGVNTSNTSNGKLINFSTNVVTPYNGILKWTPSATTPRQGSCQLTCHGKIHEPKTY